MELRPKQQTTRAPEQWFTGEVWVDPIARPDDSAHASVSAVHFHPGARSAWHSHSTGQTLYVTEGEGRVQSQGEPLYAIRAGDIVHTPAQEWHWHGAAPDHFMTHLSITDGEATWGDLVTDDEYHTTPHNRH